MVIAVVIALAMSGIVGFFWAKGIDNMNKNHPDYKGGDFLDWDDNKQHTETL